jgi:hypothetical protein
MDFQICAVDSTDNSEYPIIIEKGIEVKGEEVKLCYGAFIRVEFTSPDSIGIANLFFLEENDDKYINIYGRGRESIFLGERSIKRYEHYLKNDLKIHPGLPGFVDDSKFLINELHKVFLEDTPTVDSQYHIDHLKSICINAVSHHRKTSNLKFQTHNYLRQHLDLDVSVKYKLLKFKVSKGKIYVTYQFNNGSKGSTILSQKKVENSFGLDINLIPIKDLQLEGKVNYPVLGWKVIEMSQVVGFVFCDADYGFRGISIEYLVSEKYKLMSDKEKENALNDICRQIDFNEERFVFEDMRATGCCSSPYDGWFASKDNMTIGAFITRYDPDFVPSGMGFAKKPVVS